MVGTSMVYVLMVFNNMLSLFSFLYLSKMFGFGGYFC